MGKAPGLLVLEGAAAQGRLGHAPVRTTVMMDEDEQGVRWPAREEARVRVGPVTAYACDEARLGWSPGGGGAAGSDRSGGEDEATEKKTWRLLDPVGEEGGGDREEEN